MPKKLSKADKLLLKAQKKKGKNKVWIRYCPQCKSTNVAMDARMEAVWYMCKKCSYRAATFPEKSKK